VVVIASPPPTKPPSPIYRSLTTNNVLLRIFDPNSYGTQALTFRQYGSMNRFDHQRYSPDSQPGLDPERGIYYAGLTLSCCLVECFGDTGVIDLEGKQICRVQLTRELKLLDLRENGAMRAGSVAALAKTADRNLSQAWSRYFYEQTDLYGSIDGISYLNAHNDEEAFALYERAQSALLCSNKQILSLNHPSLRPAIQKASLDNHLDFPPRSS
jgi:hypothetical protein